MKPLSIAWKDIQILLKDRGNLIQMFLLPMIFILVLSVAQAGGAKASQPKLIALPAVNLDPAGAIAQRLIDDLNAAGGVQVKLYERAKADELLRNGDIQRILTIPANFTADLAASRQATLQLTSHPKADDAETRSIIEVVTGVARELSLKNYLVASLRQVGDMQAALASAAPVFTAERAVGQAEKQFQDAQKRPLILVEQVLPKQITEKVGEVNSSTLSVPGFAILFVFLTGQTTARSIYDEKKRGSFRRLLAAPMSKTELLIGKMLPNLGIAIIQLVVIFGVSMLLLPLLGIERLSLGNSPLAVIALSLMIALCSTSLGILFAAVARTENQIGGLSSVVLWLAGALGGAFFPLFLLGGAWDLIGKIVPHYWALRGYYDLMVRGQGFAGVVEELGVLAGFTALFFVIGLLKFDYD